MPSLTSASEYNFVNVGPLTKTFTAPQACATPDHVYLGTIEVPGAPVYQSDCEFENFLFTWRPTCYPPGPSAEAAMSFRQSQVPVLAYYSPGIACPESWITVGVAAKDQDGSISSSGVFHPFTTTATYDVQPMANPVPNVFMQDLNKGETAVMCCPSDYKADLFGFCYSSMPVSSYTATVGCQLSVEGDELETETETFVYYGTTVTGHFGQYTATDEDITTTTFESSDLSAFTAMDLVTPVTLVYRAEDLAEATKTDDESAASATETPDAAGPGRLTAGSSGSIMVAVWSTAFLAVGILVVRL